MAARRSFAAATASFTVSSDGSPSLSLSYQWRKDGTSLSDTATIFGSATPTLTLSNLLAANAGNYDVIVANSAGSVTSAAAGTYMGCGLPRSDAPRRALWSSTT